MRTAASELQELVGLVPMPRLLEALGFQPNQRSRRCSCVLHEGSNPSAFSWTETGLWKCHSCGAGGDRIALVRATKQLGFRDAVAFLAALAGVTYSPRSDSRAEIEGAVLASKRAAATAWRVRDEVLRLRFYYSHGLRRSERLWKRLGDTLLRAETELAREAAWERMSRLAPACTFFFAAYNYLCRADDAVLARFAVASPSERRTLILGEPDADTRLQAA